MPKQDGVKVFPELSHKKSDHGSHVKNREQTPSSERLKATVAQVKRPLCLGTGRANRRRPEFFFFCHLRKWFAKNPGMIPSCLQDKEDIRSFSALMIQQLSICWKDPIFVAIISKTMKVLDFRYVVSFRIQHPIFDLVNAGNAQQTTAMI